MNYTIPIYNKDNFEKMREAGRLAAHVLDQLYNLIQTGISTQEINDFNATTSDVAEIQIIMSSAASGLEEVIVSVSASNNTIESVMAIQKKSASLLDGLSSQSFKNSGASDIASAIKQVPGVDFYLLSR